MILQNRFFLSFLTCICLLPSGLKAQLHANEPIQRFELSATAIGIASMPDLFWLDLKFDSQGKPVRSYQPLSVGNNSRTKAVDVPVEQETKIYRNTASPDVEVPKMEPILTLPTVKVGGRILILFHLDAKGKPTYSILDDSVEAHPSRTVRIANFGQSRIAAKIGDFPKVIAPGEIVLLGEPTYTESNRFGFTFAVEETGSGFYKSPLKYLRFRSEDSRLLILYTNFPDFAESSDPGSPESIATMTPVAYRLYDRISTEFDQ